MKPMKGKEQLNLKNYLQILGKYNSELTITNNTKLLKDTLLNGLCIVKDYLPRRILIFPWHIYIK